MRIEPWVAVEDIEQHSGVLEGSVHRCRVARNCTRLQQQALAVRAGRWRVLLRGLGKWGLLLCLLVTPAAAGPTGPVPPSLLGVTESTRARLLVYLARGDIAGAIAMYEVHTGQKAPLWLKALEVAYSTASRAPGKCQEVARSIHTAFVHLGKSPEYVAFRVKQSEGYMIFESSSGKQFSVSRAGYHVAVRLGEMVHDAYTGPMGMRLDEYLLRLQARREIVMEVVTAP